MNWVLHSSSSVPPTLPELRSGSGRKHTPSMLLLIIVILSIIFFLAGLVHLIVRFLVSLAATRYQEDSSEGGITALQGQLRQLFHLHDAGLDQSFIDTLPMFVYKSIIRSRNDPFDCAVCLCEFEPEDVLRHIPKCCHAFHMECIDTWLLSHSTCPLCRVNLLHNGLCSKDGHLIYSSPMVVALESGSDISHELGPNSQSMRFEIPSISGEFGVKDERSREEKVVVVKLGKFWNSEDGEGSSCSFNSGRTNIVDGRRCFSMGSFAYVMDEASALWVPIRTPVSKQSDKKPPLPLIPGHWRAMSMRELSEFERANAEINDHNSKCMVRDKNEIVNGGTRKESFSISKIWLRDQKERLPANSSRRAFSFRFPITRNQEAAGSELRWQECNDEGEQSNHSRESLQGNADDARASSFSRSTLFQILGRQKVKVVHSSENV